MNLFSSLVLFQRAVEFILKNVIKEPSWLPCSFSASGQHPWAQSLYFLGCISRQCFSDIETIVGRSLTWTINKPLLKFHVSQKTN